MRIEEGYLRLKLLSRKCLLLSFFQRKVGKGPAKEYYPKREKAEQSREEKKGASRLLSFQNEMGKKKERLHGGG